MKTQQRIKKLLFIWMIGVLFSMPAFSRTVVTDFNELDAAITDTGVTDIEIGNDFSFTGTLANPIARELNINGASSSLEGDDFYPGFQIDTAGNLTVSDITMKKFTAADGSVFYNKGNIGDLSGKFEENEATTGQGAVIYNNTSGTIGSINADFDNNTAGTDGGAIYNNGSITDLSGSFTGNSASGRGGAIYVDGSGSIQNINASFTNNSSTASGGGAIAVNTGATIDSISGEFNGNSADWIGGAILNKGTINTIESNFIGNSAGTSYSQGGAIYNDGSIGNLSGSFSGNYTTGVDGHGGAIYNSSSSTIGSLLASSFTVNYTDGSGGAIYNGGSITSLLDVSFSGNYTTGVDAHGGAIYNEGSITELSGSFEGNHTTGAGGAIYNSGTIDSINADFDNNSAGTYGGAIYNDGSITDLSGSFSGNYTTGGNAHGGAIYNNGSITDLSGSFEGNSANGRGGAIYVDGSGSIQNINASFTNNSSSTNGGGAIAVYDGGHIDSIKGEFNGNSAGHHGGAIWNSGGTINTIESNFIGNSAGPLTGLGGAIYNGSTTSNQGTMSLVAQDNDIVFNGNYVTTATGQGGAIYNDATVNLLADEGKSITFVGGEDETGKYDIDGIYNADTLNINGNGTDTYAGTVNLYAVDGDAGTTNVYGGTVNVAQTFTQKVLDITNAEFVANGDVELTNGKIDAGSTATFNQNLAVTSQLKVTNSTIALNSATIGDFELNNSTLNMQNNAIGTLTAGTLTLTGTNALMLDADLATGTMDQIKVASVSDTGTLEVQDIALLSDTDEDEISLDLFADATTRTALQDKVSGNLNGLKYSPLYLYNANYDNTTGQITFARTELVNPYIYAPSVGGQMLAGMTGQIAGFAMDNLDVISPEVFKYPYGRELDKVSRTWAKMAGSDDSVEFENFHDVNSSAITVDSKAITVAAGINSDKVRIGNADAVTGLYVGYIGANHEYSQNKIEQDGGFVGLSAGIASRYAFLLSTINGGFMNNKEESMYGIDNFRMRWLGLGVKGGLNLALGPFLTLQPNVYAGYTLVNTGDYAPKSNVRIETKNLDFFEVDPGVKLSVQLDRGFIGFFEGRYAIVNYNGGKTEVNEILLPNISAKNYLEYGVGLDVALAEDFSVAGAIHRREGGRKGWNSTLNFRYSF